MTHNRWLAGSILFMAMAMAMPICWGQERARLQPLPERDRNVTTGPEVGERIPDFVAVDRSGKPQTFDSLKGPKGLVLLIVRSADW
jgi:hypothetical protein